MNVTLSPEAQAYIEERVRVGAFTSPSEFFEAAAQRQMQEESWIEAKVLQGLEGPFAPLTEAEIDDVRLIIKKR
jgi:Arc/MetJ-type ribon-helix-helix transcriptional regulator